MEFADVVARRHMVRAFDPDRSVEPAEVDRLVELACRAPSAGNTQGWHVLVLEGRDQTAQFWDVSLPPSRRAGFAWPGLLDAPVLLCPVADSGAYVARYAEADKSATGLGDGVASWTFPYWLTDTAFFTMQFLNAVTDAGLGACFFGLFGRAREVAETFDIPPDLEPIGMIALGYPAPDRDAHRPGRSAGRPRRAADEVIHRGRW